MHITQLRTITVRVPLERPTAIATRQLGAREYVLVWVDTDRGHTGLGYTYAGTVGGRAVQSLIAEAFAPLLQGADPTHIEGHWAAMYQEVLLAGRRGAALRALSAVDIALWDLLGKLANLPLYRLLGGWTDTVPAYASGGYYRPGDPLDTLREELQAYQRMGFTDFKIKVGGAPFAVDVARVRTAREVIGPQARLALDANNAWRWPYEAIRFARAVEDCDIWWLEEPLAPDDIAGHAEIARSLDMPVATGEIHATRWDFRDLIVQGAADVLQPDAGVAGGISEWLKIAHTAASFNLPVAPHWHANLHVHLAAAVRNCLTVEFFVLEQDIYNFERLLTPETRLRPHQGQLQLPSAPGLGLVLDEAAVARWRVA
ncbi:MAG: racemase [Candidatus Tectimicrobiota bacterium]|nr:MAG: racemase [Candidatus Tectomicrobia bacterium]